MKLGAQQSAQVGEYPYDVGLSFAGEQRAYVDEVAAGLDRLGIRVFYDRYEQAGLRRVRDFGWLVRDVAVAVRGRVGHVGAGTPRVDHGGV